MKIRTCSAKLTLALWCSGGIHADVTPLSSLVRVYRESPTPARRTAVVAYAAAHPAVAPLANLALGISAYEQHNYAAAATLLKPIPAQLPAIADYAAYYLAAARIESGDSGDVARDLVPTRRDAPASPFAARGWILQARALQASDPAAAARLLLAHYTELPQPETDITLADCFQAANDLPRAGEYYQRVYFNFLTGDSASRAATALSALKQSMGADYPQPSVELRLHHADRLLETGDYVKAKAEYAALPGEVARVRAGAADYLRGAIPIAWPYLRDMELPAGEADAERLYYLGECARRRNDDADMLAALQRLGASYASSPWRLRALISAANRYLLDNRPDDYLPLYRSIYEAFPASAAAPVAHWKAAFQAYLRNQPDALPLLRAHLRTYATHATAGASLYFLSRYYERAGDPGAARAGYQALDAALENTYYALLARARLKAPEITAAKPSAEIVAFLAGVRFNAAEPIPNDATQPTAARIERSRILRSAGLTDLADSELRFGSRRDGQPPLLAMEIATSADAPHQAMRWMKVLNPDYLTLPVARAPRRFWELLFPLPYRSDLVRNAEDRNLDPYLLAGLIRQESEFDPHALSRAKAYGLTQVRPVTGRQFARAAGVRQVTTGVLYEPNANLKLGSTILKSMLDHQGGSVEQTLAAYNAGPAHVTRWLTWGDWREPAEFVESIPFTETRDYVQAVMRNAEMYRRLYAR